MYLGHLTNIIASIVQHDGLLRAANVHSYKLAIQILNAGSCESMIQNTTMLRTFPPRNRDKYSRTSTQSVSVPEKPALLLVDPQASDANQAVCCLALNCVPFLLVH
jgi:hypothetical protein